MDRRRRRWSQAHPSVRPTPRATAQRRVSLSVSAHHRWRRRHGSRWLAHIIGESHEQCLGRLYRIGSIRGEQNASKPRGRRCSAIGPDRFEPEGPIRESREIKRGTAEEQFTPTAVAALSGKDQVRPNIPGRLHQYKSRFAGLNPRANGDRRVDLTGDLIQAGFVLRSVCFRRRRRIAGAQDMDERRLFDPERAKSAEAGDKPRRGGGEIDCDKDAREHALSRFLVIGRDLNTRHDEASPSPQSGQIDRYHGSIRIAQR